VNSIHSANRQFCTNLQASTKGVHMSSCPVNEWIRQQWTCTLGQTWLYKVDKCLHGCLKIIHMCHSPHFPGCVAQHFMTSQCFGVIYLILHHWLFWGFVVTYRVYWDWHTGTMYVAESMSRGGRVKRMEFQYTWLNSIHTRIHSVS